MLFKTSLPRPIIVEAWLEDCPEEMAKLPPKEEMIETIPLYCQDLTNLVRRNDLRTIGGVSLNDLIKTIVEGLCFAFFDRIEKGAIEIYSEVFLIYWYDPRKGRVRLYKCCYWKDVVQYSRKEPAIWFDSVYNYPFYARFSMKKMRPYLEKYAPHAKMIKYNVLSYLEYYEIKEKKRKKEEIQQQRWAEQRELEAEMAANREAAKEILAQDHEEAFDVLLGETDEEASKAAMQKILDKI